MFLTFNLQEMKLINTISEQEKIKIYQSYCTSFPEDERRNEKGFWELFHNPNVDFLSISLEGKSVGYLIIWKLSECIFVEHFEIFTPFRGQNLGSQVLEILRKENPKIILETEPENLNEIAKRRVNFYERNHFKLLKNNYVQPSYGEDKSPLNLFLMGTFSPTHLSKIIEEIYKIVYKTCS